MVIWVRNRAFVVIQAKSSLNIHECWALYFLFYRMGENIIVGYVITDLLFCRYRKYMYCGLSVEA